MTRLSLHESAKARSELALFLKLLRCRIDPNVRVLGPYVRLSHRLGKRVTQEELAEVVGITRDWYATLESAGMTRTSTRLVAHLADALMVTAEERARLFQLAVPELGRGQLRVDSAAVLEAFSRLKSLTKRLWAATSIEDVLTSAAEQIADWFDDAQLVNTLHRRESGMWESRALDDKQDQNDASKFKRELRDHVFPKSESLDACFLYPRLANAGDLGNVAELLPRSVQREIRKAYARQRLPAFASVYARVRSRTGLIAGFCIVHEFGHSYSASDRAVFGAFSEFTSIALS